MASESAPPPNDTDDEWTIATWEDWSASQDKPVVLLNDVEGLRKGLRLRGWQAVEIDPEVTQLAAKLLTGFGHALCYDLQHDSLFPSFGYHERDGCQGFTFLSGPFGERMPHKLPFKSKLDTLTRWCNLELRELSLLLFPSMSDHDKYSIPLVSDDVDEIPFSLRGGLFDFARYQENYRVSAHVDPGLLALSFLSDVDSALQMYDPASSRWIRIPADISVVWTGSMVCQVDSSMAVGWHRMHCVTLRKTMWFEVATSHQIHHIYDPHGWRPIVDTKPDRFSSQPFSIVIKTLMGKFITLENVTQNDSVLSIQKSVQDREGIPPAKQLMVHSGQRLYPEYLLGHHNVQEGSIISLVLSLRRG